MTTWRTGVLKPYAVAFEKGFSHHLLMTVLFGTDTRCIFPEVWRSIWYLNPSAALRFEEFQMFELASATTPTVQG